LEKSWLKAAGITPSAAAAAAVRAVEVVDVTAEDLRPGTRERLGACVRTAEPDHMMACVDEFRNEKGPIKPVAPVRNTRIPHLCVMANDPCASVPIPMAIVREVSPRFCPL
jgi:hypothetical protein